MTDWINLGTLIGPPHEFYCFLICLVFFYNYPFSDFGVPESAMHVIDILRVLQYAVTQGKVAIHCHAGRGRTGKLDQT